MVKRRREDVSDIKLYVLATSEKVPDPSMPAIFPPFPTTEESRS